MASKKGAAVPRKRGAGSAVRRTLLDRYRTILVDKLTVADLRELQSYLGREVDETGNLDPVYRGKFEYKLRQILHEEILTREIPGIEALIRELRPGDLKR